MSMSVLVMQSLRLLQVGVTCGTVGVTCVIGWLHT
jgi:hypothetical protein